MFFFFSLPSIPSIHTGMEDNPPERNIEGLETEAEECASGKQSRRGIHRWPAAAWMGNRSNSPMTSPSPFHTSPLLPPFQPFSSIFPWVRPCLSIPSSFPLPFSVFTPIFHFFFLSPPYFTLLFTLHLPSTYLSFSLLCPSVAFLSFL